MEISLFQLADRNISLLPKPLKTKTEKVLAEMRKRPLAETLKSPNVYKLGYTGPEEKKYVYRLDARYRMIFDATDPENIVIKNVVIVA